MWSVYVDDAHRFPTAGLAESYIERMAGTADGYHVVPIATR